MKIKEIRGLTGKELDGKLAELRKELLKINGQVAVGTTPKNPGQVKAIKRSIARILYVQAQGGPGAATVKKESVAPAKEKSNESRQSPSSSKAPKKTAQKEGQQAEATTKA